MATYGYRLFALHITNGMKRTPQDLSACNGEHYAMAAARMLKDLSSRTMVGTPAMDVPDSANTVIDEADALRRGYIDQPAFRVEDVSLAGTILRGTVWAGTFGSHERALSADNTTEDADIRDKAASRLYRYIMALPEAGTNGLLAVETISRSCPVASIVRWLRWRSLTEAFTDPATSLPTTNQVRPWWRAVVCQLADEKRFEEMIKKGQAEKLELVKHKVTSARTRESEEFRVTAPLVDSGKISQIVELVRSWLPTDAEEDLSTRVTDGQAAKQLAAIVSPQIEDLDLDDGWVVLKDADDQNKKISPSRLSELFTYRQSGPGQIDGARFYSEVRATALRLQVAHKLTIDWPPL